MTICIAAISERNKIIAITDKMLTMGAPPMTTTFEINDSNKVSELSSKTMALFAGDVIHANEILKRAKTKVNEATGALSVLDIAKMVNEAFAEHWDSILSNALLLRYKIDLKTFMKNQQAFDPDLIKQVNQMASQFDVGVQILIAGIDNSPKIYYVDNGGSVVEQTPLGYACIGSGERHANLSLIESEYSPAFEKPKAIYALMEAKKRAEYDPGVGEHCDMASIDDTFKKYDESIVKEIEKKYGQSRKDLHKTKVKYHTEIKNISGV